MRPNAVAAEAETSTTTASGGSEDTGGSKSRSTQPTQKPHAETRSPFASTGSDRPMNRAKRFAGVARRGASVWYVRSFAIAIVPA